MLLKYLLLFSLFLVIMIIFAITIHIIRKNIEFIKKGKREKGKVLKTRGFWIIVEIKKRKLSFFSEVAFLYKVNQKIDLLYIQKERKKIKIDTFFSFWLTPSILILIDIALFYLNYKILTSN